MEKPLRLPESRISRPEPAQPAMPCTALCLTARTRSQARARQGPEGLGVTARGRHPSRRRRRRRR